MKENILVIALSLTVLIVAGCNAESIFDLITWDDAEKLLDKQVRSPQEDKSGNCLCKGQACACCIDPNITLVDISGPGCVHMKYLSPELGFAVNVSYGKNLLHSSTIKGANSPPICLDVLGRFAQMCARFSELAPTSDGLRGCLQLEPRLLGDTQLAFPVGCFRSGPAGMLMEELADKNSTADSAGAPNVEGENAEEDSGENDEEEYSAEAFFDVVNHTAEQGISFFSSLLGLLPSKNTTSVSPEEASGEVSSETANTERRRGKAFFAKNPNTL